MNKINKLYEKLWQSLIRPKRFPYSEEDLGGSFLIFDNSYATRMDFKLKNPLNEEFYLSLYIPCDAEKNLKFSMDYIIYAHTHNGSRTEGLHLVEDFINQNLGVAVFDFRANGYSSGKFVTLGWLEALDLNEVVRFLKFEAKANSICIWGRSMGASSSVFFLSKKYRRIIDKVFLKKKVRVDWVSEKFVDCIVLDSCFNYLSRSVHNMVNSKTNKVPKWLINMIISILQGKIREKTGINIVKINPAEYVSSIKIPLFAICGDQDELVSQKGFYEVFNSFSSKIKNIKIFRGNHVEERPPHINKSILNFIVHIFKLKKNFMSNRLNQKKRKSKMSIFDNDRDVSYLNYSQAKLTINETNLNNKKNTTNFVKEKLIPKRKNVERKERKDKYNDLKKSLKHSVAFLSEDLRLKVLDKKHLENNFSIITEEDKKTIEIPSQYKIDNQINNYIKEQKIPEKNIHNLKREKINEKSYLRGLSFQIKNSTLRNRFRLNNNLRDKKIKSKNPPRNLKMKFQKKLEQDQKPQKNIISTKQILVTKQNIYVPEYRMSNSNNITSPSHQKLMNSNFQKKNMRTSKSYYNSYNSDNNIINLDIRKNIKNNSKKSINHQNSIKSINHQNSIKNRNHQISIKNINHQISIKNINHQNSIKNIQHRNSIQSINHLNSIQSINTQNSNKQINPNLLNRYQSPRTKTPDYRHPPIMRRETSYVNNSPKHKYRKNSFQGDFFDDKKKRKSKDKFVVNEEKTVIIGSKRKY